MDVTPNLAVLCSCFHLSESGPRRHCSESMQSEAECDGCLSVDVRQRPTARGTRRSTQLRQSQTQDSSHSTGDVRESRTYRYNVVSPASYFFVICDHEVLRTIL